MGRTREVARLTTGEMYPPRKRLCTTLSGTIPPKRSPTVVDIPSSSCESDKSQEEEEEKDSEPEMAQDEETRSESEMPQDDEEIAVYSPDSTDEEESEKSQDEEASSDSEMLPHEEEEDSEPAKFQDEETGSESEMPQDEETRSESGMPQDEETRSESEMPQDEEEIAVYSPDSTDEEESEKSQDEEASSESEMLPQEEEEDSEPAKFQDEETRSESEMPQDEEATALNGTDNPALVGRNEANGREVSREEYDQALKARDMALNELNNLRAELKEVHNDRSRDLAEFELGKKVLEAEKKALTERLDKEFSNFAAELKDVLESLSKSKAELEQTSRERDGYRNSLELVKKEWEDEKKALTERLNKDFNNFGEELKEVLKNLSESEAELEKTSQERDTYRSSLELGNKVWDAERIEMAERIATVNKEKENALELRKKVAEAERIEMAESTAMANKEKEKAYCKGYLDGWLKKPHAYVHAWHDARLANEVTDLPVLQMMNNLPKSHV
ncbi:probable serine/threonine-protein kinase kinX isoform X2 [Rosa chinensis]|uniref:probable serine/threonine-protein kinase kinX isoform X2 n=1 Tax=Rosa chinensis TaxID=74649 RepID=UPI000D0954E1|nr:probable serine/threonine-protein kinase kinX isoform X2 [Rosa chinensis]